MMILREKNDWIKSRKQFLGLSKILFLKYCYVSGGLWRVIIHWELLEINKTIYRQQLHCLMKAIREKRLNSQYVSILHLDNARPHIAN